MTKPIKPEFKAIGALLRALNSLNRGERARVLDYITARMVLDEEDEK